jgi:hypothetical protein
MRAVRELLQPRRSRADDESDVPAARKVLRALADPVELAILAAPLDDEPETEEERASPASSLADTSPDVPFEQFRRKRA